MPEKTDILLLWTEFKPVLLPLFGTLLAFFNGTLSNILMQIDALSAFEVSIEVSGKVLGTFTAFGSSIYIWIKVIKLYNSRKK